MECTSRTAAPSGRERTVLTENGEELTVPDGWELLPPGDGALTRLVKSKGPFWCIQVKKGRRILSCGIWADARQIEAAKSELTAKRKAPGYSEKRRQEAVRRAKKQAEYVRTFHGEVMNFLDFHPRYGEQANALASLVTRHATPFGSGTVARTERIPLSERAGRAVIAWMRHQTTDYKRMRIARVKGKRREVRRELAAVAAQMLMLYREGHDVAPSCPLLKALQDAYSEDNNLPVE